MTTVTTWPKVEVGGGTSRPTIVFLAGFPDDQESPWGPNLRAKIAEEYHAVCLCLPGYERNGVPRAWGYNFDELTDMLHATIEQATKRDEQIYLVGHDWGAIFAMRYQNKYPQKVKKLALLDVGMLSVHTAAPSQLAFIMMYQVWYSICYIISQIFSKGLASILVHLFSLPIFSSLFVGVEEVKPRMRVDNNVVLRCYVYYQMWKGILTGTMKDPKMPTCPVLFLYGSHKRFMFHSRRFLEKLGARADCSYLAVPCGKLALHQFPLALQPISNRASVVGFVSRVVCAGHWIALAQEGIALEELIRFFPK